MLHEGKGDARPRIKIGPRRPPHVPTHSIRMPGTCRFALLHALFVSIMIGCSGPTTSNAPSVSRGQPIAGDWHDLLPAANVAASSVDGAVESSVIDESVATISLRLATGTRGRLTVHRRDDDLLDVDVALGPFGQETDEQTFLNEFARRLEQLRGVDYAPR